MMKTNYPNRIVSNILGNNVRRVKRDCKSNNMVKYNYFLVKLENGDQFIEYAGSKIAAKRQVKDKGIPDETVKEIKEVPFSQARDTLGLGKMDSVRNKAKTRYYNTGEVLEKRKMEKGKSSDLLKL